MIGSILIGTLYILLSLMTAYGVLMHYLNQEQPSGMAAIDVFVSLFLMPIAWVAIAIGKFDPLFNKLHKWYREKYRNHKV